MNKIFKKCPLLLCSLLLVGGSVGTKENKVVRNNEVFEHALEYENKKEDVLEDAPNKVDVSKTGEVSDDIKDFLRNVTDTNTEYEYYLNKEVNYDYSEFPEYGKLDDESEYLSKYSKTYNGINDKDVTAEFYFRRVYEKLNHPNVGLGIMLYQAILYKLANPTLENEISLCSFHYSIIAGVNVVKSSPYYGMMKNMPDEVIDRDGFIRFSYLTVLAAKLGIKVQVISQISGYSDYGAEIEPNDYYYSVLDENCFTKMELGAKQVKDYMDYTSCDWVSYGEKSASDMFHVKGGSALHCLNEKGEVKDHLVFTSSSNLDGINADGSAGNAGSQTGFMTINHKYIYDVFVNFLDFVSNYCGRDDSIIFRTKYQKEMNRQRELIKTSGYQDIDKPLLYLGTPKDDVFEFYMTPLDADYCMWSMDNPIAYYMEKLNSSDGEIAFTLSNPKFNQNFGFYKVMIDRLIDAYSRKKAKDILLRNRLIIETTEFDHSIFDFLVEGENIGEKHLSTGSVTHHDKDMTFTYMENGKLHSVGLFNSCNYHEGAYYRQTNQFLLVKENEDIGLDFIEVFRDCTL